MDSDLSGGQRYPPFEQLGPEGQDGKPIFFAPFNDPSANAYPRFTRVMRMPFYSPLDGRSVTFADCGLQTACG